MFTWTTTLGLAIRAQTRYKVVRIFMLKWIITITGSTGNPATCNQETDKSENLHFYSFIVFQNMWITLFVSITSGIKLPVCLGASQKFGAAQDTYLKHTQRTGDKIQLPVMTVSTVFKTCAKI